MIGRFITYSMVTTENYERMRAIRLLTEHNHYCEGGKCGNGTKLERENCTACVLKGYGSKDNGKPYAPNHAGWARIYVLAGLSIPLRFKDAFLLEVAHGNTLYSEQLNADIARYGVHFKTKKKCYTEHKDGKHKDDGVPHWH